MFACILFDLDLGLQLAVWQTRFLSRLGPKFDGLCNPCLHLVGFVHAAQTELEYFKSESDDFIIGERDGGSQ